MYDNGNTPSLEILLKNFKDKVTITPIKKNFFEKDTVQYKAYNDAIKHKLSGYTWVGFIDIDEFIVLNKHNTIHDFLHEFNNVDQILLHWKVFGHNGYYHNPEGLITESLLHREEKPNGTVKSLIKVDSAKKGITTVHLTKFDNEENYCTVDSSKKPQAIKYRILIEKSREYLAHINHYQCRSFKQFESRLKRGTAAPHRKILRNCNQSRWKLNRKQLLSEFVTYFSFTCNRIYDDSLKKYTPKIKSILQRKDNESTI